MKPGATRHRMERGTWALMALALIMALLLIAMPADAQRYRPNGPQTPRGALGSPERPLGPGHRVGTAANGVECRQGSETN